MEKTTIYSELNFSCIFVSSDLVFLSEDWVKEELFLTKPSMGTKLNDILLPDVMEHLMPLLYTVNEGKASYAQSKVFELKTSTGVYFLRLIAASEVVNYVSGFKIFFDEITISPDIASRIFRERSLLDDMIGEDKVERIAKKLLQTEEELYERTKELQTTNEELIVTNEELNTINDELFDINQHLSVQSKHLKAILDNAVQGFLLLDCDMRVVSFNPKVMDWAERLYGEKIKQGASIKKFFLENESLHQLLEIFNKKEKFNDNLVEIDAEGKKIILNISASPIEDYDGKLLYYLYSIQDISEQKYQEEIVSTVFNTDIIGICQVNEKGKMVRVNQGLANLFGYEHQELNHQPIHHLSMKNDEDRLSQSYFNLLEIAKNKGDKVSCPLVWEGKKKDGSVIFAYTTIIIERSVDGSYFGVLSTQNITKEVQSETMVREMQHLINAGGWVLDRLKGELKWTEGIFNILGIKDKSTKVDSIEILKYFDSDSKKLLKEALKLAVKEIEPFDMELKLMTDCGEEKWIRATGRPMVLNGTVYRIFGAIQDITSKKEAESTLQIQNEELKKTNRYLDKFLYSTAHDLRAPVTSVLGLLNLMKIEDPEKVINDYLPMMEGSMNRLDELIKDISVFLKNSMTPVLSTQEISIAEEIDTIFNDLTYMNGSIQMKKNVVIETNGHAFHTDKAKFVSIFNNLISNAFRYCDLTKEMQKVSIHIHVFAKKMIATVEDNGEGIPTDQLDKIFEMFYRATENKTGSGLGLYIVKDAVQTLKGDIKVSSKLGRWTKFEVEIPNSKIKKSYI